jgi:hypothetical protein
MMMINKRVSMTQMMAKMEIMRIQAQVQATWVRGRSRRGDQKTMCKVETSSVRSVIKHTYHTLHYTLIWRTNTLKALMDNHCYHCSQEEGEEDLRRMQMDQDYHILNLLLKSSLSQKTSKEVL